MDKTKTTNDLKEKYSKFFIKDAQTIEETLESFGIRSKVVEFNFNPNYIVFCLEIALGTSLEKVVKHHKDIAMAVCSITGDVEIEAPIPGRSLIGIKMPISEKFMESRLKYWIEPEETKKNIETTPTSQDDGPTTFRQYFSVVFYFISTIFELIGLFVRRLGDIVAGKVKIS